MTFSLLAYNVDQAYREEKFAETRWDTRSPAIKSAIAAEDADVVVLLELRDLDTSKETARAFLADPLFSKYDVVTRRYNHVTGFFQMALLFKPDVFFAGDVRTYQLGKDPEKSRLLMIVDLQHKATMRWVSVGVAHFDPSEAAKWDSVRSVVKTVQSQPHPIAIYADCNFFDELEGIEQRKALLETCRDIAHPLYSDDGTILSGTFPGFAHDEQKKSVDRMSRLNHIITPIDSEFMLLPVSPAVSPRYTCYSHENSNYQTFTHPSDHLPILVRIGIASRKQ